MPKTKSKRKKPHWWKPDKYFAKEARENVMRRPRNLGTSRKQIALEVKKEIKRLAKESAIKWTSLIEAAKEREEDKAHQIMAAHEEGYRG